MESIEIPIHLKSLRGPLPLGGHKEWSWVPGDWSGGPFKLDGNNLGGEDSWKWFVEWAKKQGHDVSEERPFETVHVLSPHRYEVTHPEKGIVLIKVKLAGYMKEHISLWVEREQLVVAAISDSKFLGENLKHYINLGPQGTEWKDAKATYVDGLLTVTLIENTYSVEIPIS